MNFQANSLHQSHFRDSKFNGRQSLPIITETNESSNELLANPFGKKSVFSQTSSQPKFQNMSSQCYWNSSNSTNFESLSPTQRTLSRNFGSLNLANQPIFKKESNNPFSKSKPKTFDQESPSNIFLKERNPFTRQQTSHLKQTEQKQSEKSLFWNNSPIIFTNSPFPQSNKNTTNIFQKSKDEVPSIFNNKNCFTNPFKNSNKEKCSQEQNFSIQERLKELEKREERISNIQKSFLEQAKQNQNLRKMVLEMKEEMGKKEKEMEERIHHLEQIVKKQQEKQKIACKTDTKYYLQESVSSQNQVCSSCEEINNNEILKNKKKSHKKHNKQANQNDKPKHSVYEFASLMENKSSKIKVSDAVKIHADSSGAELTQKRMDEKLEENTKIMISYFDGKFAENKNKMDKILEILMKNSSHNPFYSGENPFCF